MIGTDYAAAPACGMLAANCAVCGRPLLDARSVETGIGPDCRRKHGVPNSLSDEARTEANLIVWQIAHDQTAKSGQITRLIEIGATQVAIKIGRRFFKTIEVWPATSTGRIQVLTPYNPDFVAAIKTLCKSRRFEVATKTWTVAQSDRSNLWSAIRRACSGWLLISNRPRII